MRCIQYVALAAFDFQFIFSKEWRRVQNVDGSGLRFGVVGQNFRQDDRGIRLSIEENFDFVLLVLHEEVDAD